MTLLMTSLLMVLLVIAFFLSKKIAIEISIINSDDEVVRVHFDSLNNPYYEESLNKGLKNKKWRGSNQTSEVSEVAK